MDSLTVWCREGSGKMEVGKNNGVVRVKDIRY